MRILALDIGSKYTGIAISDLNHTYVSCYDVIYLEKFNGREWFASLQKKLEPILDEISEVVIGAPLNIDNQSLNALSKYAQQCYRMLRAWTNWKLHWQNETDSTNWAKEQLIGMGYSLKECEKRIDQTAAMKILYDFFLDKKNTKINIFWK